MNKANAIATTFSGLMCVGGAAGQAVVTGPIVEEMPVSEIAVEARAVDLAICLDTSGSMSGLINAARQEIWAIVNELALAEPTPDLRVALLTYGSPAYGEETGWVNVDTGFTDDLDMVSDRLFALGTNGGDEFVGRVLNVASSQLKWDLSDDALKLIVVAGNESADQDRLISFRDACRDAISAGIMVNSIYCGAPGDEIALGWAEVAKLADGQYAAIDHNNGTVVVTTPFDTELSELSTAMNGTYVAYTAEGRFAAENQQRQDENSAAMNSAAVAQRAQTKGGKLYRNTWDLVEANQQEDFELSGIAEEDLPEVLREMTLEELQSYLEELAERRVEIQNQISEVGQKRDAFMVEEMKRQAIDESKSFGHVIRKAVREQAATKGFKFAEPPAPPAPPAPPEVVEEDATVSAEAAEAENADAGGNAG